MDPEKFSVISKMSTADLIEGDSVTPSLKWKILPGDEILLSAFYPKLLSYYETSVCPHHCTQKKKCEKDCKQSWYFQKYKICILDARVHWHCNALKKKLLYWPFSVHPDFSRPLILSIDASLDELGAVLSQIPPGETKERPLLSPVKHSALHRKGTQFIVWSS